MKRRNKYNARRARLDGYTFDSQAERDRYLDLRLRVTGGQISELEIHTRYELAPAFVDKQGNRHRAIMYTDDFSYYENGHRIVEDVKGFKTPVFRIKEKLFRRAYPDLVFRIVSV